MIDPTHQGHVRRAHPSDGGAILTLEELFPSDRMSMRSVRRFLTAPNAHSWVAELDGAVVGNLILLTRKGSRIGRIYSVVVAPPARGRHFGERLVSAAESQSAKQGLQAISLEVRADNVAARALYAKLGYQEIKTMKAYYEDGSDGLRLRKSF
jgi:ribosomal protein S18 acetylase RimI-like enzyme